MWKVELDYGRQMIWLLSEMTGPPIPPYLLEIVMKDGRIFYVNSGKGRDESSQSVVVNVWDLRTVNSATEAEIMELLDEPNIEKKLVPDQPWLLHPSLSIGRLRCKLDDIMYVVEWWTRYWNNEKFFPKETVHKMGLVPPPNN